MHPNDPDTSGTRRGLGRDIGDAVVSLTREHVGRGPVSARVIVDGDAVVVLLQDVLTKGELTLVEHGRGAEVLALRAAYQDVLRPLFIAEVERLTGRTVATFMSANHAAPDRSAEIFLLEG